MSIQRGSVQRGSGGGGEEETSKADSRDRFVGSGPCVVYAVAGCCRWRRKGREGKQTKI